MNVTLRRRIAAAAFACAAPALVSCGFDAPTDQVYTPGVGVNDRSGSVDVLHALVVSGADGSGTVIAGLVNQDTQEADALTRITAADPALRVEDAGPVEIGPESLVQLADEGEFAIEGEGITPGRFIELTFDFERGESVTVEVPVVARANEFAEVPVPSIAPATEEPAHEETTGGH